MLLNDETKIGLLLALYLSRSGTAELPGIASTLRIPISKLARVAAFMKKKRLLTFKRGDGFSLKENITACDVLDCFFDDGFSFIDEQQHRELASGQPEQRALAKYLLTLNQAVAPIAYRKLKNIMNELAANELAQLDRLDITGLEH
jgi:DNA-binding IscR family transcriptional regulator